MKKTLILSMATLMVATLGCVSTGGPTVSPLTPEQMEREIGFFVKTATRIALHEIKPPATDANMLRAYLVTGRDLLSEDGPDLDSLRDLVKKALPQKYQVFGLTVIDVIERYVLASLPDPDTNVKQRNKLITAGLNAAIAAIDEYVETKQ